MTEEQQGSTLGVFLKEVSALWRVKETDWRTATEGTTLGDRLESQRLSAPECNFQSETKLEPDLRLPYREFNNCVA